MKPETVLTYRTSVILQAASTIEHKTVLVRTAVDLNIGLILPFGGHREGS